MKTLPLYEEYPKGALDREFPEAFDGDCDLCGFHEYAKKSVCMKPTGARPKGMDPSQKDNVLLCVLDYPSNEDDLAGKPFNNRSGRYFRGLVNKLWPGPVVFDNAVRCAPGMKIPKKRQDIFKKHVDPCRPYLANTVVEVKPKRIVALGAWAIYSLLGRSLIVPSVRRGYGFMQDATPVFLMDAPVFGLRNPFLKKQFEDDLAYSLKRDVPPLHGLGAVAKMVEAGTQDEVLAEFEDVPWASFDIETAGKMHDEDFTVVSVAVSRGWGTDLWNPELDDSWVWDRWALEDPECLETLKKILTSTPMVAHNAKFDLQGIRLLFGAEVQRSVKLHGDTELQRRLNEANVLARLELAAEIVGMGGHKEEADYHLKKTIANARRKTPAGVDDDKQYWLERVAATKDKESKAYAFGLLPDDVLSRYNALDTLSTTHYSAHIHKELSSCKKRWNVWEKLVKPAIPAFVEIEAKGIAVDRESLSVFQKYLAGRMAEIRRHFDSWNEEGKPFNPGSHPQVRKILYERIGLTPAKFTDTGLASTGAPAIEQYRGTHPFVDSILDFRSIDKMDSTYATGMEKYIRDDGRIHPRFKLDGTECMPAGELVLTNRGYIPVEDVREGDQVISHTGRVRKVTKARHNRVQPILIVSLANGLTLRTSPKHQYRAADGWREPTMFMKGDEVLCHSNLEEWCVVESWPFEVSSWGRVRSLKTGKIRALQPKGKWGHLKVTLYRNGAQDRGPNKKDFTVHRLVASAFPISGVGPEVRHLNGIAWDNTVGNLRWGTTQENRDDAVAHGTMRKRKSPQNKLADKQVALVRETPRSELNDREMAEQVGVSRELVRDIRLGKKHRDQAPTQHLAEFFGVEVLSVRRLPEEMTYALTVENDCSHVTGGVVTHNTGRLSCEQPNGQNIPRADTKEGKMAKDIFTASKGNVLIQLDYGQQELRVAALLSDDDEMIKVFASGHDFHMRTAEMIAKVAWGISPADWAAMTAQAIQDPKNDPRKKYRTWAKSVNFGLLYGKTDAGLAETLGCSVPEAAAIRRAILGRFKKLDKWLKSQIYYAKKHGGIWIPWDEETARWRPLPDVMSENKHKQSNATNAAINTPIQGRASDYCLASIPRLQKRFAEDGLPVDIVLTVHDSVIFDSPEWCVDETIEVGREVMTDYDTKDIPLVVDAEVGYRWGSLEAYKEAA